jgi:hypothetical protein
MKTYKYKQKQINYKGAKKAQGKQLQSAKHPINYKAHEKTGIKHNKKFHASTKKTTNYRQKKNKACKGKTSTNAKKSKRKKNEEEEEEEE